MDPFHFACPHCSSPLRVREKLLVGRQVECPECGEPLVIVERAGQLAAEPAAKKAVAGRPVAAGRRVAAGHRVTAGLPTEPSSVESHRHQTFFRRPSWAIATGIAAILAAASIAFLLFSRTNDTDATGDGVLADWEAQRAGDEQNSGNREVQNAGLDESGDDANPAQSKARLPLVVDDDMLSADTEIAGDANASRASASDDSAAGIDDDDDQPLEPDFAPEPVAPRKIDLALSLKQPIVRFDQPRSKPLEEVLASVAEMAGTRITFDRDELGPAAARLSEPMALRQDDTTVGEILTGLLRPAGLAWRIEGDHLRLVRAE